MRDAVQTRTFYIYTKKSYLLYLRNNHNIVIYACKWAN